MADVVIRAENLSKRYRIGERLRYRTLRDALARALSAPARLLQARKAASPNGDPTQIWALEDVSFEVRQGEIVGIIGRNGSGKTTLLKILARVTRPTRGLAQVRGRMGTLLEVGTGFHPELTGRENVFLSGAILGMSKREIESKFDEIVAFSEIGEFLDTPVKHYSSGMHVRLAFAVAAHLEPEILIVDEVLAVGDLPFQRKCLGRMGQASRQGRTILFVSHNLAAVNTLCSRAILLNAGRVEGVGATSEIVDLYARAYRDRFGTYYDASKTDIQVGDRSVRLLRARVVNENLETLERALVTQKVGVEIVYEILDHTSRPAPNFLICTADGQKVFQSIPRSSDFSIGRHTAVAWIPGNTLNDREYIVTVALTRSNPVVIHLQHDIYFSVLDDTNAPTRGDYRGMMHGVVRPLIEWQQLG
jgi:lipopolysaccharide transport system ATP-binding protein